MRKVSSTEIQNNFGHYLLVAQEEDLIITRNGIEVARLSGLSACHTCRIAEKAPKGNYGQRKATYEEYLELTQEESMARYEYIEGEIFLQASPKAAHQLVMRELLFLFRQHFDGDPCKIMAAPFDITISRAAGDLNIVQPDLMVICDLREKLEDDDYYYGIPDLTLEILSESTKRSDLIKKLNLYLEGGLPQRLLRMSLESLKKHF